MSKSTRLLAVTLLVTASGFALGACGVSQIDDPPGSGASGGMDGAGAGGVNGGANPTGGVSTGGVSTGGAVAGGTGPVGGTGGAAAGVGGTPPTGGVAGTAGAPGGAAGTAGTPTGGVAGASGGAPGGSGGNAGASGGMGGVSGSSTGGTGATGGAVTCTLPNLPDASALPVNNKLPDPFTFFDGTKVTRKDQWECRRQEILAMAAKYIYAPVPTKPDRVTGTVSGGNVTMAVTVGSRSANFTATITGSGNLPIAYELSGGIYPAMRKRLQFGSGYAASIRTLFGFTSDVNPNIAIGWMIDRVMDVLEQNPNSGHDPTKMMVSGCSGCGKGAYLAGVFSRVPLTVIVESGGGGAANLRQAEWFRHGAGRSRWMCADALPQSIDNLESNGICGPWITNTAQWLVSAPAKVNNLPFDTHLLLASIAPRHLVHFSNNNGTNSWCHLGGTCEALSAWAAKPVWKALGIPERMAFQMYSAGHCSNPSSATALAGEFFKRVFDGNMSANTNVMTIMDNGVQQPVSEWQTMWVDWNMDTVLQ